MEQGYLLQLRMLDREIGILSLSMKRPVRKLIAD